jgi:hypothetical protein
MTIESKISSKVVYRQRSWDSLSLQNFQMRHPARTSAPFAADKAVSPMLSASGDAAERGG